jgi:hypothetical protein
VALLRTLDQAGGVRLRSGSSEWAPIVASLRYMGDLPADIESILESLRAEIDGYGCLKWNEEAMMKAYMMNVRRRWVGVDGR